jgi:hypothetical protein
MQHSGGCLCGSVRFETEGEPLWVAHCHCNSCRRHTGSSVATFVGFRREQVQFPTGQPATFASSAGVTRSFCARCGTPLAYAATRAPGELHLYLGCFDAPQLFVPQLHVYYAEHLPWLELNDALPRFSGGGGSSPDSWGPRAR